MLAAGLDRRRRDGRRAARHGRRRRRRDAHGRRRRPRSARAPARRRSARTGLTVREIYERAAPGVALVRARSLQSAASSLDLSERSEDGVASAAAFVIPDREGRLLTNAHAVAGATDIRARCSGYCRFPARVLGKDEETDLALLGGEPDGLDLRPARARHLPAPCRSATPPSRSAAPSGRGRTLTTGVVAAEAAAAHSGAERVLRGQRDPDGRRAQPGHRGRPAAGRLGAGDRRQLADRVRRAPPRRPGSASRCRSTPPRP